MRQPSSLRCSVMCEAGTAVPRGCGHPSRSWRGGGLALAVFGVWVAGNGKQQQVTRFRGEDGRGARDV